MANCTQPELGLGTVMAAPGYLEKMPNLSRANCFAALCAAMFATLFNSFSRSTDSLSSRLGRFSASVFSLSLCRLSSMKCSMAQSSVCEYYGTKSAGGSPSSVTGITPRRYYSKGFRLVGVFGVPFAPRRPCSTITANLKRQRTAPLTVPPLQGGERGFAAPYLPQ